MQVAFSVEDMQTALRMKFLITPLVFALRVTWGMALNVNHSWQPFGKVGFSICLPIIAQTIHISYMFLIIC